MKKLLVCTLYALSLLNASPACAIIWARQVWEHEGKTVEILFDAHAFYFLGIGKHSIDQKDLILSNNLDSIAPQQQADSVANAALHDDKVHVWVEDMLSFLLEKKYGKNVASALAHYKNTLHMKTCSLTGLSLLLRQASIPSTNIEFRWSGADYLSIEQEVATYDDGPILKRYYNQLLKMTNTTEQHHLFSARLVHAVANCQDQHQIVIVGAHHGAALAVALTLMGYTLKNGSSHVHPELQNIISCPNGTLESIVKNDTTLCLDAKNSADYAELYATPTEDSTWSAAFQATHPIPIGAIIEQERKNLALASA